jgi:hypothetical protein
VRNFCSIRTASWIISYTLSCDGLFIRWVYIKQVLIYLFSSLYTGLSFVRKQFCKSNFLYYRDFTVILPV